jgi:hypothetical protein
MSPGKILIIAGAVLAALGLLMQLGLPLFRLPGDIRLSRGNFTFYTPLATGLLLSLLLTVLINVLFRR